MNGNALVEKIISEYQDVLIQEYEKDKFYILNVLPEEFIVEIMPNHVNLFVIRFSNFQFFAKKKLEDYFRKRLSKPGYTFEVNSESIYVYNFPAMGMTDDDGYSAFKYVKNEIEALVAKLLLSLS